VRSINNVVDVTNYVMMEMGQPTHAFDLTLIPEGRLAVRWARDGETLRTLDGVERTLRGSVGVVAGPDAPLALAGIMGGASSEVSEATRTIALEAAYWQPLAIRRAVSNLVDNALRYAGAEVEIAARREDGRVVIEVLDRGPGIPAGEVERLKRPFTRMDEARSGPGGAGLGLAIVDRIARAHGGRLELAPRAGGGLAARLSLSA